MSVFKMRIAAAKNGERFFLGSACRVCLNQKRYVSTGACVHCASEKSAKNYAEFKRIIASLKKER